MSVADFDGVTYVRERDHTRLSRALGRVRAIMLDNEWHTLAELSECADFPEATVSARLRDLRKEKFGSYTVERQYIANGLWAYRIPKENA